jgi:hypothetical protein
MKPRWIVIVICAALLVACAPSAEAVQQAISETQAGWTPIPTQTAFPTYTPQPTYTAPPTVFVTKIVTQTHTPTPVFTPTITDTPSPTLDPLQQSRGNGFYLVNVDIAPGIWRSQGTNSDCYWVVTDETGDIIANHFGQAGGTAYIPETAFQVEFSDCGTWIFLNP